MRKPILVLIVAVNIGVLAGPANAAASVEFNPSEVILGNRLRIRMTGVPNRVGDPAALQEKINGSWTRIQRKTIVSGTGGTPPCRGGCVTFFEEPTTSGIHWYRVVVPADGRQSALIGQGQPIPVRRWRYLMDLTPSATAGPAGVPSEGSAQINDRIYTKSLTYSSASTASTTDYTLPNGCREFRAVLGLAATSSVGSEAELSLYLDGVEEDLDWSPGTMEPGDENSVANIDLTGVTTLRLEHREVVADADVVFGNARALCY